MGYSAMKVLMLGWELPPHNSGGLGVACYQMCKALSKQGVDIEFILPYQADHGIDFMNIHAAIRQPIAALKYGEGAYDSQWFEVAGGLAGHHSQYELAIEPIAVLGEFDIIHAHDWLTFRAALRAKQLSGKPLVVHIHATEYDRAGGKHGNPMVEEIEYAAMSVADRVITVSEHTKETVIQHYDIAPEKIEVVHNSIELDEDLPVDERNVYTYLELLKTNGWKVVGCVGRLTVQKGLVNLLQAMQKVVAKAPKTILLLVGSGEQREELIRTAADYGLAQNVLFVEFQRGKAWRDSFAISDLFVMPSISEPFGLTALEAIAFGSPTLISYQSGVAEVIKNCLKVDYWDTDKMANKIVGVLKNDVLREELRRQSSLEYSRMSWYQAAHKMKKLYEVELGALQ